MFSPSDKERPPDDVQCSKSNGRTGMPGGMVSRQPGDDLVGYPFVPDGWRDIASRTGFGLSPSPYEVNTLITPSYQIGVLAFAPLLKI